MEKYETIDKLGEGAFATVSKERDINTGEIVAIKKLKKKYSTWQECVDLREVKSLNKLKQNDNIVKLKEMIRVEDTLYLVFEYMEKNLYDMYLERNSKKFNESQIRCIMHQILSGIAYMHKYGFFHRDLKPENFLVSGEVIKIADFGLAREIRSLPPYTDYVSTRWYRAPECILKSTNYSAKVDIWALGCIMAELYTFKPLFGGLTEKEVLFKMCAVLGTPNANTWTEGIQLAKKIDMKFPSCAGTSISQIVPDASKDGIDFINEMLKWDPQQRPMAADLLKHPFFTKYSISNRISTPEYNTDSPKEISGMKSYSNNRKSKIGNANNSEISYITKNNDDISKMLEDTSGFNKCIKILIYI